MNKLIKYSIEILQNHKSSIKSFHKILFIDTEKKRLCKIVIFSMINLQFALAQNIKALLGAFTKLLTIKFKK